jgi:hypothetical protein
MAFRCAVVAMLEGVLFVLEDMAALLQPGATRRETHGLRSTREGCRWTPHWGVAPPGSEGGVCNIAGGAGCAAAPGNMGKIVCSRARHGL